MNADRVQTSPPSSPQRRGAMMTAAAPACHVPVPNRSSVAESRVKLRPEPQFDGPGLEQQQIEQVNVAKPRGRAQRFIGRGDNGHRYAQDLWPPEQAMRQHPA